MWLFLIFILVPLIEIGLFIQVGGLIGLWPTLGIVILTAVIGTTLVRSQGLRVIAQIRGTFEQLSDPTEPLAHGAMILFSGALLLTPGFFTDAMGLALLVPGIRTAVYSWVRSRVTVENVSYGTRSGRAPGSGPDVIDGEFYEVEDPPRPAPGKPSGWTRH